MSWRPLSGVELRVLIVRRAVSGRAFWLLPVEDETGWQFGDNSDAPALRVAPGARWEFLASHHPIWNDAALSAMPALPGWSEPCIFWSPQIITSAYAELSYHETWGIFEPLARERMGRGKSDAQLLALQAHLCDEALAARRPHPGFPPPMRGGVHEWRRVPA